jgi:hypothetical protein
MNQESISKEQLFLNSLMIDIRKIQNNIDTLTKNCHFIPRPPIQVRIENIESFMAEFQYIQGKFENCLIVMQHEIKQINKLNKPKAKTTKAK